MKKTLISFAAFAAIVCVGYADTAWFNGGINGQTLSGGSWDSQLPTGVTSNETNYALQDVESFAFTADVAESTSASQNLDVTSKIKFTYAYDEWPDVAAGDKAGIIVYANGSATNYWVLATNTANSASSMNVWVDTGIAAPDDLSDEVSVNIVLSNGVNSTWAIYNIGSSSFKTNITTTSSSFQYANYSGSGYIDSLVAYLISLGYPIPGGGDPIPTDKASEWAQKMGYTGDLAKLLADTTRIYGNRTAADSCILGVATNAEIKSSIDDVDIAAEKLQFTVQCTPIDNSRVSYVLSNKTTGASMSSKTITTDFAEDEYTIYAIVDSKTEQYIPVSKTIGVKNVPNSSAAASATTYCAVPYTADEGDISVSNLFKKALLASEDQIDVFNSSDASWTSFKFTDGAWAGVEKAGVTPDPATTTLKRGQAFKFTRAKSVTYTPAYLGYVSTDPARVSMPVKKYELVSKSDGSAYTLSTSPDDANDWAAKVEPGSPLPAAIYKNYSGTWKKSTWVDGEAQEPTDATSIEGGFFLMNRGSEAKDMTF